MSKAIATIKKPHLVYVPKTRTDTIEHCMETYKNAEKIVTSVHQQMQPQAISYTRATALSSLKFLTTGKVATTDPIDIDPDKLEVFYARLEELDLMRDKGLPTYRPKAEVYTLLQFKALQNVANVLGVTIQSPNNKHTEVLKKLIKDKQNRPATPRELLETYQTLAIKHSEGKPFKSAKALEEAFNYVEPVKDDDDDDDEPTTVNQVYIRPIYTREHPKPEDAKTDGAVANEMLGTVKDIDPAEWKELFRELATIFHTDKGGDNDKMAMLNKLNKSMNLYYGNEKRHTALNTYEEDYTVWKEDRGYTSNHILEKDINPADTDKVTQDLISEYKGV